MRSRKSVISASVCVFEAASPYFVINFASSFVFASSCSRRLSFSLTASSDVSFCLRSRSFVYDSSWFSVAIICS